MEILNTASSAKNISWNKVIIDKLSDEKKVTLIEIP